MLGCSCGCAGCVRLVGLRGCEPRQDWLLPAAEHSISSVGLLLFCLVSAPATWSVPVCVAVLHVCVAVQMQDVPVSRVVPYSSVPSHTMFTNVSRHTICELHCTCSIVVFNDRSYSRTFLLGLSERVIGSTHSPGITS